MKGVKARYLVCGYDLVLEDSGFLWDDAGRITRILPNGQIDADEVIDAWDSIVLPGFVNAHMHQYGILSRGVPVNATFTDFEGFLKDYWWPYLEDRIRREQVLATAEASCAEMLRSGVTSFCDTLEAPFTQDDTLFQQAKRIEQIGMRAIVSLESSQRVNGKNGQACLAQNVAAVRWCRNHLKRVRGAMCTHTTFTCDADFIRQAKVLAQAEQALFQFHLSESVYEPSLHREPAFIYENAGALDGMTLASQCVQMTRRELELLAERDVKTVHMPLSNCEVGGGFAPVPDMLDLGICVGLGTDGYINDFFTVMKGAFLMHKANRQSAAVMPAPLVFRMATENGARCLGLERVGRLEKDWRADFCVVKDHFASPVTAENLFDQLVVHGQKEWITHTAVDGSLLLRDGKLTTLDEETVRRNVKKVTAEFWNGLMQSGDQTEGSVPNDD